jgi:hypothetical protein
LARCPRLTAANFACCRNITDAAALSLAKCPQLETVNFAHCGLMTARAAEYLANCPQLKTLALLWSLCYLET